MSKELLSKIERVLSENKKAMHVNDIAVKVLEIFPNIEIDRTFLPARVSSALAGAIGNRDPRFSKPKNTKGRFKKGMYRLKRRTQRHKPVQLEMPMVTTQYTGAAGEYAVLSELLFWGLNPSKMVVDDGIDIVASKDNKFFHLQVKTSNSSRNETYQFNIPRDRFNAKHANSMFYIFVMRRSLGGRHTNDFAIMPSSEIKKLVDSERIVGDKKLNIKIQAENNSPFMLNNEENITWCINNWASIV